MRPTINGIFSDMQAKGADIANATRQRYSYSAVLMAAFVSVSSCDNGYFSWGGRLLIYG